MAFHIVQIGCGIVGYSYVCAFEKMGFKVSCIEANQKFIENNKEKHTVYHVNDDMSDIQDVDFVLLSINTPLKGKKLDLTYLFSSIKNVAEIVKNNPDAFVVLRSTVPAGTTRKYKDELEAVSGQKCKVLFQPEFLRDKTCFQDAMNPWHVVFGCEEGLDVEKMKQLFRYYVDDSSITVMTIDEAENMKLFHNSFNAAKISFFNQCKLLVDEMNKRNGTTMSIDAITGCMSKTCEGLMNTRYGTKAGHGYYGSCLPKDSAELASLEEDYGLDANLFRAVVDVNNIIVKTDKEVVLGGDHHMLFDNLKRISSNNHMA
jgi:UDPglucose 6-dehydrogenase